MSKFLLIDTFNNVEISSHLSEANAHAAQAKHSRAIVKRHGSNSYIPTKVVEVSGRKNVNNVDRANGRFGYES